jgi:N-acetylglucosaminyl-diphospho-decaprenol L-rhamnosyltransferase
MRYSISVVSHNSGKHLEKLLMDLSESSPRQAEVILTINTPEDESYLNNAVGFPLKIIRNSIPLGFGANHNQAFASSSGNRFVIVNPDVRIQSDPWCALDKVFDSDTGACAPIIRSPTGAIEDSVRRFPTIGQLLKRVVLGIRRPDYIAPDNLTPVVVDWVAGMFVMFDSASFRAVGGFDTSYFMYLEDVDICRRLGAIGKKVLWVPNCAVVHNAQRASRKSWQHRRWHARSMMRFLFGV